MISFTKINSIYLSFDSATNDYYQLIIFVNFVEYVNSYLLWDLMTINIFSLLFIGDI